QRDALTDAFAEVVRDLELGTVLPVEKRTRFSWGSPDRPPWNPPATIDPKSPQPKQSLGLFPSARWEDPWDHHLSDYKNGQLQTVALSPQDRGTLAVESRPGIVSVYHRLHQATLAQFEGHKGNVLCLDFSPDARLLASGSMDQTVRIWDLVTGQEKHVLGGH